MTLTDILDRDLMKIPLQSTTKHALIEELVDVLVQNRHVRNREELLSAVLSREALGSTGLADGIAIPHAKTTAVDTVSVVMGITREPIDFDAQDGKGSQFFFLVLAPEHEASAHIEVLASIARATASPALRRLLAASHSADEVMRLFLD
ncbi:MAG TPA: PTS fructose transporter subunit IIC [Sphaerochaeta sp.]|jgi:fructose-specific phosphotransferase system IIA component|nr:MAG: PTS fructose transporter subunit IIC [Spirochaetes bacterium GWC2_52_13]PKL11831.1 MAG: PTS fructose transporter subunit IIC [Spirochaetae bacterium HGW-Spirochaetae-8]PKL19762.1 MAG: PTS fructose transporter subunit IIC [Spirochaetae bacterium HGW-Spirochaetae-4]HCG64913.1 PTS fructose transporter subunit IIC [Sphaerochaeta sp.]HCJ94150.1 PTS fructose transporter subunit IIC [Sphaerochaeta sp.]